jgi:hypothetical protein
MLSILAVLFATTACSTQFDLLTRPSDGLSEGGGSLVSTIVISVASSSLAVGGQTQVSATPKDASNNDVTGTAVTFESNLPAVATVSATTGIVDAIAPGTAIITATAAGRTAAVLVTVTAGTPPSGGVRIPLIVERFDAGTTPVLVSNAIPLTPGLLFPTQLNKVRMYVSNVEQSIHVELLEGRHPDGSVRSVMVQFFSPVTAAASLPAELVIGQARGTTDLPKPSAGRSMPSAVALPTDADYLVGTNIVGPTLTAAASAAQGIPWKQYEGDFKRWADYHWTAEGETGCNDYYDRALIYYAAWARTGNVEWWRRGTRCAQTYRVGYLEANNYASSPHWSQLEGLEAHYLLTGDDSSRYAIGRVAQILGFWYPLLDSIPATKYMEDRIRARTLMSILLSWRVNAGGQSAMYRAQLDTAVARITHSQSADGSYRFPESCMESVNYMTGQLNDALIKTYLTYKPIPEIPAAVKRSADFLWTTQWLPTRQAFQYVSGTCAAEGNTNPGLDLNNLIVNTFAFTYGQTRDATYRDRADQVFAGAIANTSLDGSKQFNQQYTSSFLYLYLRQ